MPSTGVFSAPTSGCGIRVGSSTEPVPEAAAAHRSATVTAGGVRTSFHSPSGTGPMVSGTSKRSWPDRVRPKLVSLMMRSSCQLPVLCPGCAGW